MVKFQVMPTDYLSSRLRPVSPSQEDQLIKEELPGKGWKLLHKFGELLCSVEATEGELDNMLDDAVSALGKGLSLDRCLILLWGSDPNVIEVVAEYTSVPAQPVGRRSYQLGKRSEFYQLVSEGKPVPLKDIRLIDQGGEELGRFVTETDSRTVVAFPIMGGGGPLGIVSMHYMSETRPFSDALLELGEMLSQELGACIALGRSLSERSAEDRFFTEVAVPAIVFDRDDQKIIRINGAARRLLPGGDVDLAGMPLIEALPGGQGIVDACEQLNRERPVEKVPGIVVVGADQSSQSFDALVSLMASQNELAVVLYPDRSAPGQRQTAAESDASEKGEGASEVASLSRQLTWERWMRQIICRIHSSLDRDSLLQSVADSLGRALALSRCVIVRTDGMASPMVTHEYAEPDISPLGLGRTGQFPQAIVNLFKSKPKYIGDISIEKTPIKLSDDEIDWLAENGYRGILGAPIAYQGIVYGVIIGIVSGKSRQWQSQEMDMLEVSASETAVALTHSQAFLQVKDQLFNMNLLGNLTQQLTNTLELAARTTRGEEREEKAKADAGAPPLSVRELEVLKLIASGLANREIAQRLFLTESTVELHASRIRKKLKLKSRTALVKFACDNNLV